jgi:hypothetical protein
MRGALATIVICSVGCETLVGIETKTFDDFDGSAGRVAGSGGSGANAGDEGNAGRGSGGGDAGSSASGGAGSMGSGGRDSSTGGAGSMGSGGNDSSTDGADSMGSGGNDSSTDGADSMGSGGNDSSADASTGGGAPDGSDASNEADGPPVVRYYREGSEPSGYDGTSDSYIQEIYPTSNFGGGPECNAHGGTSERTCLFRWDLVGIPLTAVVLEASVSFEVTDGSVDTYGIFPIRASWTEAEVTWENREATYVWSAAGAKAVPADRDQQIATIAGAAGAYSISLDVAEVQRWVSTPSANHGILIASPTAGDSITIATSENATVSFRPMLMVTYTPM